MAAEAAALAVLLRGTWLHEMRACGWLSAFQSGLHSLGAVHQTLNPTNQGHGRRQTGVVDAVR